MQGWIRFVAVMMLALGFLAHGSLVVSAAAQVGTCKRIHMTAPSDMPADGKAASGQMQAPPCKLIADRVGDWVQVDRRPTSVAPFPLLVETVPDWSPDGFERPPKVTGRPVQPSVS